MVGKLHLAKASLRKLEPKIVAVYILQESILALMSMYIRNLRTNGCTMTLAKSKHKCEGLKAIPLNLTTYLL
jgi:hypothetical protein